MLQTEHAMIVFDEGIDFKNRRIYWGAISEPQDQHAPLFTWRSVERMIRAIHVLETINPKKSIELHMSSPGGDAIEMMRLYDTILASPCQIVFVGGGMISSSATWIMCVCDERYLYPNTVVLVHDGPPGDESFIPSRAVDHRIAADFTQKLQENLNKMYAQNSRMPVEFWTEFVKRDLYLTAEETIILGLADKIIEPKKRGNLRKSRIKALKDGHNISGLDRLVKNLKKRIYSNKNIQIEIQIPEEKFDKTVIIDNTPESVKIEEKDALLDLNTDLIEN